MGKRQAQGAGEVFAIDVDPTKVDLASDRGMVGIDASRTDPVDTVRTATGDRGADIREGPPIALRFAKEVIDEGGDASADAAKLLELHAFGLLLGTDDAEEGATAFMDDRNPMFEGH